MKVTTVLKNDNLAYSYIKYSPNEGIEPLGIILCLHGQGEGGPGTVESLPIVLKNGIGTLLASNKLELPYIFIFPQAPINANGAGVFGRTGLSGYNGDGTTSDWLKRTNLTDHLLKQYPNFNRENMIVYGISAGGASAQSTAVTRPEVWGKLIAVCPAKYATTKHDKLKDTPSLFFHSQDDTKTSYADSFNMVSAIKAAGGKAELIDTTGGHAGAWLQSTTDKRLIQFIKTGSTYFPPVYDFEGKEPKHYKLKFPEGASWEVDYDGPTKAVYTLLPK